MTDVFDAMEALAGRFAHLTEPYGLTTLVGPVKSVGTPPALLVEAADGDFLSYLVTMDDAVDAELTVTVFVQYGEDKAARDALRPYLADTADTSDRSVRAIVAADPTLGGIVSSAVVRSAANLGKYTIGAPEKEYLGVEFAVAVML